ncbi:YdaU family protein [Agrobacterium tumefaciens]|uniref:YdaU family protein n=1 Tax=Agrobacterium tumefaciens TaxID=358 RepID=UPI0021D33A39|nr:YdaU family protein [Agrobacterium tumefaciens]UXS01110.1 YdaU family protein [Agrobacterium tumefaciens]
MSRRTMPYHRRYQGDALQGYRKLTLEQRGAYTTILDLIYDEGGPIERNERWLAGELNCSLRKVKALLEELIELRKIYITRDKKISNHRAEVEIGNALNISRKRAENGSKRKDNSNEKLEKRNKINDPVQQLLDNCVVIPVPVPDINNNNASVSVETQSPEEVVERFVSADPPAVIPVPNRLIESLDRRTGSGAAAALAARRSRQGGGRW